MIDFEALKKEQLKLAKKVSIVDSVKNIKTIAGADQAYAGKKIISAIAVCDYKSLRLIEEKYAVADAKFPYKSSFLFYKDGPAVIEAFNMIENKPDVLIVEGNGILHPKRIGMASHVGILLDTATIGVTKTLMLGEKKENTIYVDKEARGYELVTREHARPIYVSPGHNISLKTSLETIKKTLKFPHKLPEPLHIARKRSSKARKDLLRTI